MIPIICDVRQWTHILKFWFLFAFVLQKLVNSCVLGNLWFDTRYLLKSGCVKHQLMDLMILIFLIKVKVILSFILIPIHSNACTNAKPPFFIFGIQVKTWQKQAIFVPEQFKKMKKEVWHLTRLYMDILIYRN